MADKMKTKILVLFAVIFIAQLYLASALTITSVTSTPEEIQPGEKVGLDLEIENNLNEDIEEVVVTLVLNGATVIINGIPQQISPSVPFAPYQSSNSVRIDNIDEEDKESADFDLMAFSDAVSGTYTIPVQISYTLSNNGTRVEKADLGVVSVIINAKPKIDLSYEGDVLIKGTGEKVTIRVINSGLGDSKFLSVTLNTIAGMQLTGSNKVYIGNIDSNDFDTADFEVFVSADAPLTINLPIELTYTDSRNKQITETKTISLKTYTMKEATELGLVSNNNTSLIIFSILGVLVVFFVYRKIRKKNRNKRNGQ